MHFCEIFTQTVPLTVIYLFQDISEISSTISSRRCKYEQYGMTLQPSIFFVDNGDNSGDYYCVLDNIKYRLPTAISALTACFECHQVFNLKYSAECHNCWIFIQRFLYKIITPYDRKSPSVTNLEKRLDA